MEFQVCEDWFQRVRCVSILDVLSFLGHQVTQNGKIDIRNACFLPNHQGPNRTHTVFSINTSSNVWYCFACRIGGGNIELVMRYHGCSVVEAANFIAKHQGLETFDEIKAPSPQEKEAYRKRVEEEVLVSNILKTAAHHFHSTFTPELRRTLLIPQGNFDPKDTWKNIYQTWGLTDEAIDNEETLIGFDDGSLFKILREQKYNDDEIFKSGLFHRNDDGSVGKSVFSNRLTFPYFESGRVVNFIARSTARTWPYYKQDPSKELENSDYPYAKYKKIPLYEPKKRPYVSQTIRSRFFGISELRRHKNGLIVEGLTDVILCRMFFKTMVDTGIEEAKQWGVGSFVSNHISNSLLGDLCLAAKGMSTLLFLCDNEESEQGIKGAKNNASKLLEKGVVASIGELPRQQEQKVDPASWVQSQWEIIESDPQTAWQAFQKICCSARNIVDITIQEASQAIEMSEENGATPTYINKIKKRYSEKALTLISHLPEMEQEDYLALLTKKPFKHKITPLRKVLQDTQKFSQEADAKKTANRPFSEIHKKVGQNFLVTDTGVFFQEVIKNPFSEKSIVTYHHLCSDPVIVKNRARIQGEEECAYVILTWEDGSDKHEIIVPMDYLQAKNSDKLCKREVRIISNKTAKAMSEYFEIAIQDAPKRTIYRKLGWSKDQFIIPGIISDDEIFSDTLDLGYRVQQGNTNQGIEALKTLANVAEGGAFYPLLLHILLPPAARLLKIEKFKYSLFLIGQTGNYKTALASTTICIYGIQLGRKFIRFQDGATDNAAIKNAAVAGHLPILLDNYKPNIGGGERRIVQMISSIVEGRDKLRLDHKGDFKKAPELLAWPIVTGEAGIEKDTSAIARCIEIEFIKSPDGLKYLRDATEKIKHLPSIGHAWINWLQSPQGKKAAEAQHLMWTPLSQARYEQALSIGVQNPARVSTNFACLDMILHLATKCPLFSWLSEKEALISDCIANAIVKMANTTREAREGVRFLEIIQELLSSGQCILGKSSQANPMHSDRSVFIGWDIQSEKTIYLLPDIALHEARKVSEIIITKNSLYRQLEEEDAVARKGTKGKTSIIKWLGGAANRVLAIKRDKILLEKDEVVTEN